MRTNRDILDHRHWLSISSGRLMTILEDEEIPLRKSLTVVELKILRDHQGALKDLNHQYQNEAQWFYFYIFFYVITLAFIPPLGLLSVGAAFYVKNKQDRMKEYAAVSMKHRNEFIHKISVPVP